MIVTRGSDEFVRVWSVPALELLWELHVIMDPMDYQFRKVAWHPTLFQLALTAPEKDGRWEDRNVQVWEFEE